MSVSEEAIMVLAEQIARGEVFAGNIIAEFANGHDAANFVRIKGGVERYTVTPGINLLFAVRPWICQPFALVDQCDHCGGVKGQHATDCDRPLAGGAA